MGMVRGLVIRFFVLALIVVPMVSIINIVNASPGIAMLTLMTFCIGGSYWLAIYCLAHEDEIPTRSTRHRDHHA